MRYEFTLSGDRYVCSRLTNTFKSLGPRPWDTLTMDLYDYEFELEEPAGNRQD